MTQLTDMPDAVDSAHQRKTLRRGSRAMTTAADPTPSRRASWAATYSW